MGTLVDDLTLQLRAAQRGDRRALGAFIRATHPEVWRLCAHLVSRDEADDVTQDVYLRAWRSLPGYRAEAPAKAWLLSIARRSCADAVRSLDRRRQLRKLQGPSEPAPDPATAAWISDLVARLPRKLREAFTLTQITGLSYAEAAVLCGCPVGTIRSRVARARAALVDAMNVGGAEAKLLDLTELEAPPQRPVGHEL